MAETLWSMRWDAIDDDVRSGHASKALAKTASLIRANRRDWKAAMFGISVVEQHRFPIPAAPQIRHADGNELTVARLSPDGARIVTGSFDGTARIWDSATSGQIGVDLRHDATVLWADFSPDGQILATCSDDRTVRLWDVASGAALGEPLLHTEAVVFLCFSPDGKFLMTNTSRTLSIFHVRDRSVKLGPLFHAGPIVAAKFVNDGQAVFTAQSAEDKSLVQAWDLETGERQICLETGFMSHADISSDLTKAVTIAGTGGTIWDVASRTMCQKFTSPNGRLNRVLFSPKADRFVVIGNDHWARVYNTETGKPQTQELQHYYLLDGMQFLGHGDQLMTWAADSLIQIWDSETGERMAEPFRHVNRVVHAESGVFHGREVFLSTISHLKSRSPETKTGAAQLWHIHDKSIPISRTIGIEPDTYDASILSPDGRWIAISKTTREIWVLDRATGDPICGPIPTKGGAWAVYFTPDCSRLIATTSAGEILIRSMPSGEPVFETIQLKTTIQPAELSLDGKVLATGSTDGFIRMWDVSTGKMIWESKHGSEFNSVAISPDQRMVASAGEDRVTQVWNAKTGERFQTLTGHENEVMTVRFSPDNRRIVTASLDSTACIWEVSTGKRINVLSHRGEVLEADYSPDGKSIATGSRDQTAMIWDAETGMPRLRSLRSLQAVRNVQFSPDGTRLAVLDFRGLQLWDAVKGYPLTVHLKQPMQGGTGFQIAAAGPQFSPDGQSIYLAFDSRESYIWDVTVPPPDIPRWFPDLLEAIAGQRYLTGPDIPEAIPTSQFLDLKAKIRGLSETDYYTTWAKKWIEHD